MLLNQKGLLVEAEIVRFCRVFVRNVGNIPIRSSEFAVLDIICALPGPHTPVEMARKLGVSKAMISGHLSVLINKGYVVRVPSPEDRRSVYVMPTKRGKDLFNEISRANNNKINDIKSKIGDEKFSEFVQIIRQINQFLD